MYSSVAMVRNVTKPDHFVGKVGFHGRPYNLVPKIVSFSGREEGIGGVMP